MEVYKQIGLCMAPLVGGVLVYSSLIGPVQVEVDSNGSQIESIEQQYNVLEIKLKQRQKLQAKQKSIHKEILRLRDSVPEKPDLDLLMLDLVKICDNNQVTLLGVETHDPKSRSKKKKGLIASLVHEVGGKMPQKETGSRKKVTRNRTNTKSKEDKDMDLLGLKHETRRVFITGEFNGLVGVLNNLEKYQRIVGIRDLIIANPEDQDKEAEKTIASEKGKELGLSKPVMTFLLHIYYLPS